MNGPVPSGCPDRGLFVLIPDQRPSERVAPEVPDRSRTVAGDRSEASAAGEEGVVRLDDAELVAFGVGEHDVSVVGTLTDVDVAGAELDQPRDRFRLVVDGAWLSDRGGCGSCPPSSPGPAAKRIRNLVPSVGTRATSSWVSSSVSQCSASAQKTREAKRFVRVEAQLYGSQRADILSHTGERMMPDAAPDGRAPSGRRDGCPVTARALNSDRSAERLDAVDQSDEPLNPPPDPPRRCRRRESTSTRAARTNPAFPVTAYHVTPLLGGVAQPSTVFNERRRAKS